MERAKRERRTPRSGLRGTACIYDFALLFFFFYPLLHRALYFSHPLPEIEKQLGRDDDDDSSQSRLENAAAVAAAAATQLQSLTSGGSLSLAPNRRKEKQGEGETGRVAAGPLC